MDSSHETGQRLTQRPVSPYNLYNPRTHEKRRMSGKATARTNRREAMKTIDFTR
ncbi:hypothetical protein [Achromobacter insuavis]|uniref:hypothetical protein n=1 Tax=Achromobacter insuavis TaxID=1287735 RepID=UPI0015D3D899|nr:hypothetical protein [Achromobacter insuavis]